MAITSMAGAIAMAMARIKSAGEATAEEYLQKIKSYAQVVDGGSEFSTGEFPNHWEKEVSGGGTAVTGRVNLMAGDYGSILLFQHGNPYFGEAGIENFAHWYNSGTGNSAFGFPTAPATHYWDTFEADANANFVADFVSHMGGIVG